MNRQGFENGGDTPRAFDAVIIGAGPAGLFCAVRCAMKGLGAVLLEKNRSAGRKLLISGAGRCNLTHSGVIDDFLTRYGDKGRFVKPALMNFTNLDLMAFFAERGLPVEELPDGKIFPASMDARDVLGVLLEECSRLRVRKLFGEEVTGAVIEPSGFTVSTRNGVFTGGSLVIATGGRSYPATGSTGDGYSFAKKFGHTIEETRPALTPVIIKDHIFGACTGISLDNAAISLYRKGKKDCAVRGDVLFTHRGLSGPGILDMSRRMLTGDTIRIAVVCSTQGELGSLLADEAARHGRKSIRTMMRGLGVPERLADAVLKTAGTASETPLSQLGRNARRTIAGLLTGLPFEVKELGGYSEAMVTCGGVSTAEINRGTMESRIVPRLFFAGEVIDVDGDTGGYNLQFAFSSGALAADGIARRCGGSVTVENGTGGEP